MNNKIKQLFAYFFLAVGILSFSTAFVSVNTVEAQYGANDVGNTAAGAPGSIDSGLKSVGGAYPDNVGSGGEELDVAGVIRKVINWALYLAGMIAVLFVIIGGYLYLTSAGDAGQAGKGRTTVVNALIGLAIVVLSYVIVQAVYTFLVTK